jgi:hypothetical protein
MQDLMEYTRPRLHHAAGCFFWQKKQRIQSFTEDSSKFHATFADNATLKDYHIQGVAAGNRKLADQSIL